MSADRVAAPALKYWRWKSDLTQVELAAKSGVSDATIRKLERGSSAPKRLVESLTDALQQEWREGCLDLTLPLTTEQQAWVDAS